MNNCGEENIIKIKFSLIIFFDDWATKGVINNEELTFNSKVVG